MTPLLTRRVILRARAWRLILFLLVLNAMLIPSVPKSLGTRLDGNLMLMIGLAIWVIWFILATALGAVATRSLVFRGRGG